MMAAVSALASVSDNGTGRPTRTVTLGGLPNQREVGHPGRARPDLLGPPQPDRDDRGTGGGRQPRRARLAVQHRVEEVVPTRDGALREDDHHFTRLESSFGGPQGLARTASTIDGDAADGPGDHPDDGRVEDLLLAQEAHRTPDGAGHECQRGHVEVAAVVRGQQHRTALRHVLDAGDVEARIGKGQLADERTEHVVRLEPDDAGDARRTVPVLDRPAPRRGDDGQRGIRVDGMRACPRSTAAARRRCCRCRRGNSARSIRCSSAQARTARSLPVPQTKPS